MPMTALSAHATQRPVCTEKKIGIDGNKFASGDSATTPASSYNVAGTLP
jgi:hypothetical protein